jgi:hypothetical protein
MELSFIPSCDVLEVLVMLFQVVGVASLCACRLLPGTRWAYRGRRAFVMALVGLGMAGALCGSYDSHFALFAGATLTALLIGMIVGGGSIDLISTTSQGTRTKVQVAA